MKLQINPNYMMCSNASINSWLLTSTILPVWAIGLYISLTQGGVMHTPVAQVMARTQIRGRHGATAAPPVAVDIPRVSFRPPPRIMRDGGDFSSSLPRFGPLYGGDEPYMTKLKDEAWELVVTKSEGSESEVKQRYIDDLRRICAAAKDCYPAEMFTQTDAQFCEMMIRDGCFFLHLAFLLLGAYYVLGYPTSNEVFSEGQSRQPDIRRWIEAMLRTGNQIPQLVIRELMKGDYFMGIITEGQTWEQPRGVFRKALYRVLGLPGTPSSQDDIVDLLHSLQRLVVGTDPTVEDDANHRNHEPDIELGGADIHGIINDGRTFLTATEMEQSGIIFKAGPGGSKGIRFSTNIFYASLHLPAVIVDEETELVFKSLVKYEMHQFREPNIHKREVSSYLRLMKEVVRAPNDITILEKRGIILPSKYLYKEWLLNILNELQVGNCMTPELHTVRLQTGSYKRPATQKILDAVLSFVTILAVIQILLSSASTVFTILNYVKDSHNRTTKN